MQQTLTSILVLVLSTTALAMPAERVNRTVRERTYLDAIAEAYDLKSRDVSWIEKLVPSPGVVPGTNPNSTTGMCDGFSLDTYGTVSLPCACPLPTPYFMEMLVRNVLAGEIYGTLVEFSNDIMDMTSDTNKKRGTTLELTMVTPYGGRMGCPITAAPNFRVLKETGEMQDKQYVPSPSS
ncbi:unnamed protein product [Discula destructiva]